MDKSGIYKFFRFIAILGNVAYILWITYNGIDDGFSARPVEIVAVTGLLFLLILNIFLLFRKQK